MDPAADKPGTYYTTSNQTRPPPGYPGAAGSSAHPPPQAGVDPRYGWGAPPAQPGYYPQAGNYPQSYAQPYPQQAGYPQGGYPPQVSGLAAIRLPCCLH